MLYHTRNVCERVLENRKRTLTNYFELSLWRFDLSVENRSHVASRVNPFISPWRTLNLRSANRISGQHSLAETWTRLACQSSVTFRKASLSETQDATILLNEPSSRKKNKAEIDSLSSRWLTRIKWSDYDCSNPNVYLSIIIKAERKSAAISRERSCVSRRNTVFE